MLCLTCVRGFNKRPLAAGLALAALNTCVWSAISLTAATSCWRHEKQLVVCKGGGAHELRDVVPHMHQALQQASIGSGVALAARGSCVARHVSMHSGRGVLKF